MNYSSVFFTTAKFSRALRNTVTTLKKVAFFQLAWIFNSTSSERVNAYILPMWEQDAEKLHVPREPAVVP